MYASRGPTQDNGSNDPAGVLDAGGVDVLGGECRLAGEECWLLRRSIIRNVAMLRARLGDVQDGRKRTDKSVITRSNICLK
jgi:hypothetical protein